MTAVIELVDLKQHLNIDVDANADDDLLTSKIDAAQECVEKFVGAKLDDAEVFPDGCPEPLKEAVRRYAGHLYEDREGQELPTAIFDALGAYRTWVF